MNSNKFFSFSRFYLLMRNDILLNHKKYLLTIAGAFVLGFIIIYMQMPSKTRPNFVFDASNYVTTFMMCLLGLGAFVGSAFSEFSNKVKTSNYLLLPASNFEKFLSQFLIRAIVGTILFLVIFWIDSHLARIAILSHLRNSAGQLIGLEKFYIIKQFHYSMLLIVSTYPAVTYWRMFDGIGMIMVFFSTGMFMFSIKIFFRKLGLIKTAISLVAVMYLLAVIMIVLSHLFYPETIGFKTADTYYLLSNGYSNNNIFIYSIAYLAPLFLIPLGYFKFKEKQL